MAAGEASAVGEPRAPPPPPQEVRGWRRERGGCTSRPLGGARGSSPAGSGRGRKRKCLSFAMAAAEVSALGGLGVPDPDGGVRRRR